MASPLSCILSNHQNDPFSFWIFLLSFSTSVLSLDKFLFICIFISSKLPYSALAFGYFHLDEELFCNFRRSLSINLLFLGSRENKNPSPRQIICFSSRLRRGRSSTFEVALYLKFTWTTSLRSWLFF